MIASVLYHLDIGGIGGFADPCVKRHTHTQLELNFAFAMNVELVYQKSDIAE